MGPVLEELMFVALLFGSSLCGGGSDESHRLGRAMLCFCCDDDDVDDDDCWRCCFLLQLVVVLVDDGACGDLNLPWYGVVYVKHLLL